VSVLLAELVADADGERSKNLTEYGSVEDKGFWENLDLSEKLFLDEEIYIMDVRAEDILVKRLKNGELIPAFADYKKFGRRAYPFQPFLAKSRLSIKIKRMFKRIRERYRPAPQVQIEFFKNTATLAECA